MIDEGHRSCEFISPILQGAAGVAHLVEFVAWLQEIGAKVNKSCGLHVHVGVTTAAQSMHGDQILAYVNKLARLVSFNSKALYAHPPLDIPDEALDKHTERGRRLRRGHDHFWNEGAKIENAGDLGPDPYEALARKTRAQRPPEAELDLQ